MNKKYIPLTIITITIANFVNTASAYHIQILFRDDFNGTSLDLGKWHCREIRESGITQFRGCPEVNNGFLTISHHTYDPNQPGEFCLSQEINTIDRFEPNHALEFKARLRIRAPVGNGLVAGFFSYMDKPVSESDPNLICDEIDFEFLTNQINNPYPAFLGDRLYTAVYNDCHGCWKDPLHGWWENPTVPKFNDGPPLDLTKFNIFKIRLLGDRVEWWWEPYEDGNDVLIYRTSNVMPDEAMSLYFNFWGSDVKLPIAWDENLRPASSQGDDSISFFDIDFAQVSYIFPDQCKEIMALGYILKTDFDADCIVDFNDFAKFADDWLK